MPSNYPLYDVERVANMFYYDEFCQIMTEENTAEMQVNWHFDLERHRFRNYTYP